MDSSWIDAGGGEETVPCLVAGGPVTGRVLLFVHENRGLTPYMREVIGELAELGFTVVAPDLLHRVGGSAAMPGNPDVSTRLVPEDTHEQDLVAVFDHISRTATPLLVGFCFGAEMGWRLVTRRTPERAALLYGIGPDGSAVGAIRCPVFAVYAEDDPRVNGTLDPLLAALAASHVEYRLESYPGTRHAFHDRHRPERYDAAAARHVWIELVGFLGPQS